MLRCARCPPGDASPASSGVNSMSAQPMDRRLRMAATAVSMTWGLDEQSGAGLCGDRQADRRCGGESPRQALLAPCRSHPRGVRHRDRRAGVQAAAAHLVSRHPQFVLHVDVCGAARAGREVGSWESAAAPAGPAGFSQPVGGACAAPSSGRRAAGSPALPKETRFLACWPEAQQGWQPHPRWR